MFGLFVLGILAMVLGRSMYLDTWTPLRAMTRDRCGSLGVSMDWNRSVLKVWSIDSGLV